MRILILNGVTVKSGTGLRMLGIAEQLSRRGHEVMFVGKGIEGAHNFRSINIKANILSYIKCIRAGMAELKKNYDVVISSKAHPVSCLPVMLRKTGAKKVLDFDDLEHAYWKGPVSIIMRFFERFAPKHFDVITVHNDYLRNFLEKNGVPAKRIYFLPQGIDFRMFQKKWKLSGKKKIIYAAHLGVAAKDLGFVLNGVKELSKTRSDFEFVVIGSGKYLHRYKRLAEKLGLKDDIVKFPGYVKHEDIPKYLATASAAVNYLKSSQANMARSSIKLREYLAASVPVICNVFGSDMEQFRKFVFDFDPYNSTDFAEKINIALRSGSSKDGRRYVQRFDWSAIVKEFEKNLKI